MQRRESRSFVENLETRTLLAADLSPDVGPAVAATAAAQVVEPFTPASLPELGLGLGGVNYYGKAWPFSNALMIEERGWRFLTGGSKVPVDQLDALGYPTALNGQTVFAQPFQNNAMTPAYPLGRYVVTWEGTGDVTLNATGATLVSGSASTNRRVYNVTAASGIGLPVRLSGQNAPNHVHNVKVWMPDPSDPLNRSLEPAAGQRGAVVNPSYLNHLNASPDAFGVIRFMDWTSTNNNPQVNWSDRRPPRHAFGVGSANYKQLVVPGTTSQIGSIGVAWEHVIELANTIGKDAWINIPHAATNDYVQKLARLFRYGSDAAGNPYASAQASPYHAPLRSDLRVWVEHSNEIWSSGGSFRQGDWAQQQATLAGVSKGAFNGRRAGEMWEVFNAVFAGETPRVVKPAGAFTAVTSYTREYLDANVAHDRQSSTATKADTLAVTTYFGQPLVNWAFDNRLFLDTATFNDPTDATVNRAIDHLLNELVLAGTATGGERDSATGGFGAGNKQLAEEFGLPLVSYEGNSSMYTETAGWHLLNATDPATAKIVPGGTPGSTFTFSLANYVRDNYADDDANPSNDDRLTKLIIAVNRNPRFAEVYRAHLANAKSLGLYTHGAFVDVGAWSKYGQWGHKEYFNQPSGYAYGQAIKWQTLLDFKAEQQSIRELGVGSVPINARPDIPATGRLDSVTTGQQYARTVTGTPGDGTTTWSIVAGKLPAGLAFQQLSGGSARISGTVAAANLGGEYRFLVRALDSDGDVDYAIYSLLVLQPQQTIALADFDVAGAAPGQTSFLDAATNVPALTGVRLDNGPGLSNTTGVGNTLSYSGVTGATLAAAVTNNDYITLSAQVQPGTLVSFDEVDLRLYSQNGRTTTFTLRSNLTGTADLGTWTAAGTSLVRTNLGGFTALKDTTGVVEFRLYLYGSTANQYESIGIGNAAGSDVTVRGSFRVAPEAAVVSRNVFYNNSYYDTGAFTGGTNGNRAKTNDDAIATDKRALANGTATFANYTSYDRGINGLVVDLKNVPNPAALSAADFAFHVTGHRNTATPRPVTALSLSTAARPDGVTRVYLTFADYTITKTWLRTTVLATAATGLKANDVFYFGNAIGESGNSATDAGVTSADDVLARLNPRVPSQRAADQTKIDIAWDYNKDGLVSSADQIIPRLHATGPTTRLALIVLP